MGVGLEIKNVFKELAFPSSDTELDSLKGSLIRDGCMEPIIVWNDMILDGHKRYKICTAEKIPFDVQKVSFDSEEDAVIWLCRRRIGEFISSDPYHRYLIGKWYIAQKAINKRARTLQKDGENTEQVPGKRNKYVAEANIESNTSNNDFKDIPGKSKRTDNDISKPKIKFPDTSAQVAKKIGTTRSIVQVGGEYAEAMDKLAEEDPLLYEAILRKDVHFSFTLVIQLSELKGKVFKESVITALRAQDKQKRNNRKREEQVSPDVSKEEKVPLKTGIKEMPEYDPDMELKGLMLTIPTWINQIARVEKRTDMNRATGKVKEQLDATLLRLREQIDHMRGILGVEAEGDLDFDGQVT